jgi:hypothetical protein
LAVDAEAGRVAVILNRADVLAADPTGRSPVSRGRIVLDAVAGAPRTVHRMRRVQPRRGDAGGARVTMWDGGALRRVELLPAST